MPLLGRCCSVPKAQEGDIISDEGAFEYEEKGADDYWIESLEDFFGFYPITCREILILTEEGGSGYNSLRMVWKGFLLGFRKRFNLTDDEMDLLVDRTRLLIERGINDRYFGL